jgi:hypothetical protein
VSGGEYFADGDRESVVLRIWRFACTLFTFFVGTLVIGVLVGLALSASACTWNTHVRCFSIAGDTLGVISSAAEIWFMLALVAAFFAATIAQMYRALVWWTALIVVPVSILGVSILPIGPGLPSLAREAMLDPLFFFAVGSVLFAGYQFSLFIGKLVGKLQP